MVRNDKIYLSISAAKFELGMVIIHRTAPRVPALGAVVGRDSHHTIAIALAGAAGFGEGAEAVGRLLRANGWLAGRLGFGTGWGQNSTREDGVLYS